MELSSEAQFHLKEFSPHQLLFLPRLNALLAVDSAGRTKCIDVVTGAELHPPAVQVSADESGRGPPPVHFTVHPETSKVVVAAGNRLGARSSYGRSILLATILQTPVTNPQDEVSVEVPMEQILDLLQDFQILIYVVVPELLRALRSVQVQLEKNGLMCNLKHHKCATATFTGKAQVLCDAFKELVNKLKSSIPPTSANHARTFVMALPCLPVLSAWHAQMQLLLPETHAKVMKFESATELPTMDSKMMHIEGVRKLTLVNWPHKDYVWAVPKAMSEAGFYHLTNAHGSQASITSSKGDRVSCFACKMYLYSWEPTDEPWSEHERHTGGCPFIRGEYTENVPSSTTEASHPAVYCSENGDSVVCISSTSTGTGLTAVGTERGHISIWELDRGLLIMKYCEADIKIVNGVVETSTPEDDKKPSLEVTTETSTTATGTTFEDSPKKETTTVEEASTKEEKKEATPQVTITVEVQPPPSEEESKDEAGGEEKEAPPPSSSSSPPGEDEIVKSKLPSSSAADGEREKTSGEDSAEAEDRSSQPVKKQNFHITALSILSPQPPKEEKPSVSGDSKPAPVSTSSTAAATGGSDGSTAKPEETATKVQKSTSPTPPVDGGEKLVPAKQLTSASSSSKQAAAAPPSPLPSTSLLVISPALVGGVSIINGGQCTPTLLVYSIKSNRPIEKGSSEQKVKPPMPPPPDPLDYDPWEPIELAPSYMGAMPPSASSSVLDVFADAKSDGNTSPADLKYLHSIPLDEFSCGADSGAMPEIREILPLAGGQMLAVLCNISSTSPLLEGEGCAQKGEDPSNYGGMLLFRTTIEEDGDRLRLRVDEEPIKIVRFSDHSSTVVSMCVITHGEDARDEPPQKENKPSKKKEDKEREREKERDVLLGAVTRNGVVTVYDCSSLDVNAIGHYSCHSDAVSHDQESSKPVECISCTYCASTYHLAVGDSSGQLNLLSVRELLLAREKFDEDETNVEESQGFVTRPLTSIELDKLLVPTRTSPDGVPYSLTLPTHWSEIHYFQLHRASPVHLHLGEGRRRVSTRVWHHQPPSMEHCREDIYTFELVPESAVTTPIGCVSLSMTFANRRCINERATVTLMAPKLEPHSVFAYSELTWKPYDVLCGPVKLKPLVDVTGQSLQLSLFHPFLITRRSHVLWLEFKDFFAAEYNDIAVTADTSSSSSKRSGWRSGGPLQHRLRQQNDPTKIKPVPLQCTIAVTLHPTSGKLEALSSNSVKPSLLFKLTSDPEFMSHVVLAASGYRIEEKELSSLPPSIRDLLKEGASVSTVENQFKALELLSWMVGVHLTSTNSGGYTLLSTVVGQLLTSLLHACFIRGNRSLIHKCARLVVMLYRGRDGNRSDFRYSLNNALVQLLPLLPLASSAACIHFFLRLVATLTESCDSHMISRLCLTLLVELTKQLNSKSSFASQLLQTHFKHDGHIFEPELFDIYLSYCQKSTSFVKPQSKYVPGSSSYVDSEYYSILPPDTMSLNTLPPDWSHIDPTSTTIAAVSASAAQDSSTLQVIADKGGHTIYDMELQLLLDCSKKTKAQAVKAIDEHPTFKHGSFLLFAQRGLLETLPLHYQCVSVSGNVSVQEANVHTLPNVPEGAPSTTSGAPVVAVSKTMGYNFPTTTANTATTSSSMGGGRKVDKPSSSSSSSTSTVPTTSASERAQKMQRMPEVLSNILVSAKELVMQIPSLKSGLSYSVVIKFPHRIYLTDISIPAAMYMSSVSVDVWLEEGGEGEAVRVAHSSEIKERSMILGNLMPAPFCQFAKVTFVGRLGANREKAQVFIGSFYGRPVFTGDTSPSPRQLLSLEENILSQYHGARDRLSQALLSYAGLSRKSSSAVSQKQLKQCEEKVGSCYQECFKAQVQLARLRHFMKSQHDKESAVTVSSEQDKEEEGSNSCVFSVDEDARSLDFHEMTFSRLSKIVGCLVDAILILNEGTYTAAEVQVSSPVRRKPFQRTISFDPEPPRFEDKIIDEFLEWSPVVPPSLNEEECSLLFLSLCIHGVPKLHARACALLTRLCGSQEWWGRFITNMALELFNVSQPGVFNKDRALLQLSILSQRTYDVSNVIQCILQVLDEKLTQLTYHSAPHGSGPAHQRMGGDSAFDHTLLQWLVLLLSHVLASIATQNQPKSHTNLFVPLPLLPSSLILSLTQPTEQIDGESRRAELAERRRDLKRMLTSLGQKIEFASAEEKIKLKEEFDAIFLEYQSLRKQLLAHHRLLRQQKSAAAAAAKKLKFSFTTYSGSSSQKDKDKEKEKDKEQQSQEDLLKPLDPDPALSSLPQSLCQSVARGLVHYIIVLTTGDSWDFLPVACKSLSQMVALTSWAYPLHSLISQEQINSLIWFSCQHVTSAPSSSGKTPGSLEWGQRAVQCLLIDILHHGEIKPYFESMNKSLNSKMDMGEKTTSSSSLSKSVAVDEDKDEDKLPPDVEQELQKMGKMFDKAPLEVPQILLSCGEVEIPLNRRTWKGRKGLEEMKKHREKEKKKLQEAKGKKDKEAAKIATIPEAATEDGEATKKVEKATPEKEAEETTKVLKVKDPESVGGISVADLKRYLRQTYLQGDFEHMVDFPPPEKHSYGLALHNPLPPSCAPSPYLSYIISNCIDYRVLSSLEVSAELELQLLARKVYESVLHSLLHARPTPDPVAESLSGELSPEEEKGMFLESDESDPFAASTSMLTLAIEQLLERALTPQSNLDLVSVLEFCNDLNSLLPVSSPLLPKRPHKQGKDLALGGGGGGKQSETTPSLPPLRGVQLTIKNKQGKPDSNYSFTVPPVCSREILSLLLNCLANTQTPSSKMWQIGLSVLHTSLRYLWYFVAEKKGAIDVDYDKLLAVFVKLFSSRVDAVELREANLTQLLTDIIVIKLERGHGKGAWYGIGLLLELLITILDKRDMASLDSCLLLQLLSVISVTGHLLCLWNSDEHLHYEVIGLIKKLSVSIINLLPDILEQARHPAVVLNGGEQDEEHRRYRYIRSSGQDTKVRWIPVVSEVSHSNRIAAELIQLLREVLILPIPEAFVQPLRDFCRDHSVKEGMHERVREDKREERKEGEEGEGDGEIVKPEKDYLRLSPHNYALLSLVYSDMPLMSTILKLLSSSTTYFDDSPTSPALQKQGKDELTGAMVQNLFCNFVRFLDSHCKDHSCFFEPILEALRSTSSELRVSKTFMTVVGRLTSEFESECNQEKLINFISEGGGRLVLGCLVSGCKQSSPSISRGIPTQSINKLGQKDTLKSTMSGNQRINFFPHATVRLHPSRTSIKELQSSSNTETPTRTACFNHTYQGDEEWLKMQISLPYPILLHTVQFLQPMGMFQSGPSAVFIECGTQGTLSPPTPVTSLLRTSGLPCVKIEFKQPPVASEVVIHFRSPLVSSSLALSHMQLLGTGFGTTTKSSTGSTSSTTEQSGKSGIDAHSSAGWLFIIDQWMGLSRQISDKLMSVSTVTPDFLPATLSLLQHQDTLSSKSSKQLKRLLVAMAMYSQDYGMAIVQHLLGFSPEERVAGSTNQSTVPVTTTTLDLLHQLCVPTSEENRQRLQLALRLLSNIPLSESSSVSHQLPTLIRVLSSAIWEGGKTTPDYDEGIFNSLAEHAFSLDVDSPMKSAINSLLCALCYCTSDFFAMLLANCSRLLDASSEGRPKLLHTLAHVAQSVECSSILLHSDLMNRIIDQLYDGFDQLLKAAKKANPDSESDSTDGGDEKSSSSSGLDVRSMLSSLCTSLAFLTDFVRNWTPGKDWMALEENRRFWPLMVELFSMDMACITKVVKDTGAASSVVAFELSFCQKVVLEYFSSCLNNHTENKKAFVRLVCNSVKGAYSFNSAVAELESDSTSDLKPDSSTFRPVLTPFLHNLILELVLQPESIPIILKQTDKEKIEEPPHKLTSSGVNPLSFTPTHECLDFHPSFPVGSACYSLEMSPSSPLSKLASQFDTPAESKPAPPKPKKDPAPTTSSSTLSSLKLPLTRKSKPPPAPPSTHSIEISNFELRKWLLPGSSFNPLQEDEGDGKKFDSSTNKMVLVLSVDHERTLEDKSTLGSLLERSREMGGEAMGPALILHMHRFNLVQHLLSLSENKEKPSAPSTVATSTSSVESLLSLFVSERGLSSLALCLPSLYRYQWPEKTSGLALPAQQEVQVAPATATTTTTSTSDSTSDSTAVVEASKEKASLFVSQVLLHPPNILPFHSILTLGLCLRVDTFDATLSQNLAMVYVLLRLVLGTELEDLPFALSNHLSFFPYLVLLETLKTTPTNTPEGQCLRKQLLEVGVVHHTLQCLSSAGHHSPRVDSGEAEPMQMEGGSSKRFRPRITTSADHHYWAKGTGFGTGSTTSNWNMEAITAKQKAEEKYVSLCFAILAEFLSLGTAPPHPEEGVGGVKDEAATVKGEASESTPAKSEAGEATAVKGEAGESTAVKGEASEDTVMEVPSPLDLPDYCTPELAELLSDSCLLPAMASYLLNDSVLDISKHIELYQSMLDLLSSIVVHPTLCHLLRLPVFSSDNGSAGGDETTLASLIAKLREITKMYQKTAKTKQPKAKKNLILHTHVPLSMLLTSFYTYKKPPKPSTTAAGSLDITPPAAADSGQAEGADDDQVVPGSDEEAEQASKGEKKKEEEEEEGVVKEPTADDEGEKPPTDKPTSEEGGKEVNQSDKSAEKSEKPIEGKGEEKGEAAVVPTGEAPPTPTPASEVAPPPPPPRVPPRNQKPRTDVTDLAILVKKILSVSEQVGKVVSKLKRQEGSYSRQASVSTPIADTAPASFDFYMKAMKPLQFDTYQILEESEYGTIRFHVPYHFQSRVQSATSSAQNAARSRRLAQEVATLSTSLPLSQSSSVFVRCDEERLDVMKVLITGPSDTPYANGCFEFDVFFPPEYPKSPMLVHMRTTGQGRVRFNPNLYNDGKVCLSVLNTWHGRPEEKWNAQNSSFLQVLVSIQSLILVPEPYFNEPGYEQYRGTPFGDQKSLAYNANIYASTVQWAMVDAIKNTSPCFKEVVLQHFYLHKSKILAECEEWKKQLVDGISKMQEGGGVVNHIKEYLRLLAKATDQLKVELDKIKPEDFRREGEEEEEGEGTS